ncbi:MAG: hypothetical protein KIS73_15285 [Enhydrobacter sp.]|nr:hypothetical protein [Enhydrobacter sp.]
MLTFGEAAAAVQIASPSFGGGSSAWTGRGRRLRPAYFVVAIALVALAIMGWFWMSRPTTSQVAEAWGLLGVWQHDCAAPARLDNPRYHYSIDDGKVILRRDYGRGLKDTSVISDLEATSPTEIRYVVHFAQLGRERGKQVSRQNILVRSPEGRVRTVANKNVGTGEDSVVQGVRVEGGNPTPWMTRCPSG